MKLRLRLIPTEEREDNPTKIYLWTMQGAGGRKQAAVLEQEVSKECEAQQKWQEVEVVL